jgi:hypothetical protein
MSRSKKLDVGPEVVKYMEAYRAFTGGVHEGFVFGYRYDRPINLVSFVR